MGLHARRPGEAVGRVWCREAVPPVYIKVLLGWDTRSVHALVPDPRIHDRRAFMDIDTKIQLQMVRDRFIDGQTECALRRHLDSLRPNTPMTDIVDCCRVWERHCEVEIQPRTRADRRPVRVICQVTEVEPAPAEKETVEDLIRKLLPTPALPPPQAVPRLTWKPCY